MGDSPSQLIDARIEELGDWRGEALARIRALVKQADPDVIEEWKWRGVPVWYHVGIVCTGETYKSHVKMTFAKGASLDDPSGLFNSSLEGNTRRAKVNSLVRECRGNQCKSTRPAEGTYAGCSRRETFHHIPSAPTTRISPASSDIWGPASRLPGSTKRTCSPSSSARRLPNSHPPR